MENAAVPHADLAYWQESEPARRFRQTFEPTVVSMEFRLPDLENAARQHVSLSGSGGAKHASGRTAKGVDCDARAAYRRRLFGNSSG